MLAPCTIALALLGGCASVADPSPPRAAAPAHDAAPGMLLARFDCAGERISVAHGQRTMVLSAAGESFAMQPRRSASGARYEAAADPRTTFWNKSNVATVTVRGRTLPECTLSEQSPQYRARGNEPFWAIDVTHAHISLRRPGVPVITAAPPRLEAVPGGRRHVAFASGQRLAATVLDRICVDDMSAMPHPDTVIVHLDDAQFRGCGGEPGALLRGAGWVVEDIAQRGIIDDSRVTLHFDADGAISGLASCNAYRGRYTLSGEALTISSLASTRRACAPALMTQEQRVLDLLQQVSRFAIDAHGALVLHAPDGRTLTARR